MSDAEPRPPDDDDPEPGGDLADLAEQRQDTERDVGAFVEPTMTDAETPVVDAIEQAQPVGNSDEDYPHA